MTVTPTNSKGSLQYPSAFPQAQHPWGLSEPPSPKRGGHPTSHFPKHILPQSIQITDQRGGWRFSPRFPLLFSKLSVLGQAVPKWSVSGERHRGRGGCHHRSLISTAAVPGTLCQATVMQCTDKCPRTKWVLFKNTD